MRISQTGIAGRAAQRGSALVTALVAVAVLGMVSASVFALGLTHSREIASASLESRALYVAEGGFAETAATLAAAVVAGDDVPQGLGTEEAPLQLAGGRFWSTITNNGDDTYTLHVTGTCGMRSRRIEGMLVPTGESAFDHAIFAGNSSEDPDYTLPLGGEDDSADRIIGNVYSGANIEVTGDAWIDGGLFATGDITTADGTSGTTGTVRPPLDLASEKYNTSHHVDVARAFHAKGYSASNALGGTADQVDEKDEAHIFRRNPSDRTSENNGTEKDDYYLEDPYEPATSFNAVYGKGHEITLSGGQGQPGASGNEKVYYIDGNLWVHNAPMGGVKIATEGDGTRIVFAVRGNIYFSDDVILDDETNDALAFIAVKDEDVEDSGNIYFGDPRWGTLEYMHAYLYAENDFYDNNLDSKGSREVLIRGNMTAGNHVAIERDYVRNDGSIVHSKLEVEFDDRITTGRIEMPQLPEPAESAVGLRVAYWREVAEP